MTQQSMTIVKNDGSGTNTFLFGLTQEVMQQFEDEDPFADFKQEIADFPEAWQTQVKPWQDDTYEGISLSMQFTDPAMLQAQLEQMLGAKVEGNSALFDPINVQQEGSTISILAVMQQSDSGSDHDSLPPQIMQDFQLTWSIELPTIEQFTEQKLATREGNRVTWDFPFHREREYRIEITGSLDATPPQDSTNDTTDTQDTAQQTDMPGERCFAEAPYCITGRMRQYWEEYGGLPVFGLPITPQHEEIIEGQPYQVQWFERNRLELHPENPRPYDVLPGRLGVVVLEQQGQDWQDFPTTEPQDGCLYFAETGHNICGDILVAWRSQGLELDGQPGFSQQESLALAGLPISGLIPETLSDGNEYMVQYFERARLELHPENDPPYHVLFGLLGSEVRQ
jgi:hypothetical protein